MINRIAFLLALCAIVFSSEARADFVDGNIYGTYWQDSDIVSYDSNGNAIGVVASTSSFNSFQGVAFGPDQLLYAYVDASDDYVVAFNSSGQGQATYNNAGFAGNTSVGDIVFVDNNFFVSTVWGVRKFTVGDTSGGSTIYSEVTYDMAALSNGNLLVAEGSTLREIDTNGGVVRTISLSDPNDLAGTTTNPRFSGLRGLEYDAAEDVIYAAQNGYTNFDNRLLKVNASNGELLAVVRSQYLDDLELLSDGRLAVGNNDRIKFAEVFDKDLNKIRNFTGERRTQFLAQFNAVPEPSSFWLLPLALVTLGLAHRRKV